MIPQLIISNNSKVTKSYLKKLIGENHLFFEIKSEGKEYSIRDIKGLIKETSIFHKNTRVYFLENFHLSSLEAQNAFLKILEEPPEQVLFVLSADNENKIIPTIISRVKIIRLDKKNLSSLVPQAKAELNKVLASKSFQFFQSQIPLDDVILFFRDRLSFDKKAPLIIKETLRLKNLLENNNLNSQLTIDHVLIFIWKTYRMK